MIPELLLIPKHGPWTRGFPSNQVFGCEVSPPLWAPRLQNIRRVSLDLPIDYVHVVDLLRPGKHCIEIWGQDSSNLCEAINTARPRGRSSVRYLLPKAGVSIPSGCLTIGHVSPRKAWLVAKTVFDAVSINQHLVYIDRRRRHGQIES